MFPKNSVKTKNEGFYYKDFINLLDNPFFKKINILIVSFSFLFFPLAIPLIAGPGAMTTALLIAENNARNTTEILINFIPILIIVILVAFAMWLSASLSKKVGPTIIIVVQKIFGILLGALAIEFVVAGIIESFKLQGF